MRLIRLLTFGLALWFPLRQTGAQGTVAGALGQTLNPIIRSWQTPAGLPQNTVTSIAQTPDGYLWLGTRDGLARFDGRRFKVFGLAQGLPSVDVRCLLVDRHGVLWIGTYGSGLCCRRQGRIETVPDPSRQPGSDTITCLQEDATGRLWVGTSGGLRFCRSGGPLERCAFPGLSHAPIRCLLASRDGRTMWIGNTTGGLMAYRNGHLRPVRGPAGFEKISPETLFEDRQGRLWVGIGNGRMLCRQKGQWRIFDENDGLPFAYVTCLTQDAQGTLWAGSLDAGLYRLVGGHFHMLSTASGLSADDITSLYCDPAGDLWVGTRTGGLDCLSRPTVTAVGSAQGLTNDFTDSVAQTPDGTIWVGTIGGSLYRGVHRGGTWRFTPFRPDPIVYFYADVDAVLAASDGSLWWGSSDALLHWQNHRQVDCITNEPWLQGATVTALQNDRRGGIWIGTDRGQLVHFQNSHFVEFPKQVTRAAITSLAVGPDGRVWVGTVASGLQRINPSTRTVTAMTNGLLSTSIRTLYLDPAGTLWIGTQGGGLSCWRTGRFVNFTNLPPTTVSQIVADDLGHLWLGCNRGIFEVKKQELLAWAGGSRSVVPSRSFGFEEGMPTEECSGGFCPAGLVTRSGLICMATVKGLVFLDPARLPREPSPPRVLLDGVVVKGRPVKEADAGGSAPPRLLLGPGADDVELHYTAIEFAAPEKIRFRYKLAGLDSGWTEAGPRRTAYYQHIPPGQFVFQVEACNPAGIWSAQDTTLAVTVRPFFWETPWFRAASLVMLVGCFAGLLGLAVRRRYKLRLSRLQTLNAIERERLRISKDMHDHVGGVLTQVSQFSEMGLTEADNQTLVQTRLERIGHCARVAVQALDEIVWATNPRNDNLASFAEYISRFGDEFFESTGIRCWQEMPADLPALPLRADVRHNVFLAVRETLNNALKHSRCTEVWLKMRLEGRLVTLDIEDNGSGFAPGETSSNGNGLDNMRSRLGECGGETILVSAPGSGTRVRFRFRLSEE